MIVPTGAPGRDAAIRGSIAAMGQKLGPSVLAMVQDIYRPAQTDHAGEPALLVDAVYGPDPRHRLDVYAPASAQAGSDLPVLLWVHGGGFVRGEKASPDHPYNAHVGRWAARHGMIGAVMNYRLAPDHVWPAGGEDVGAAIDWLSTHAAALGGNPARIVPVGTSAGAVHISTHLHLRAVDPGVAGAVLLSGLYGFTPLDERDTLYFGDPSSYGERAPKEAVVATDVPLLIACAELDPPRFQAEMMALLGARLARHGKLPGAIVAAGHNHFSLACHIGTGDTQLADAIRTFIAETAPIPSATQEIE